MNIKHLLLFGAFALLSLFSFGQCDGNTEKVLAKSEYVTSLKNKSVSDMEVGIVGVLDSYKYSFPCYYKVLDSEGETVLTGKFKKPVSENYYNKEVEVLKKGKYKLLLCSSDVLPKVEEFKLSVNTK